MCSELQADKAHEDPRQVGQGHLQMQVLQHAVQRSLDVGEAHAQVRRQLQQEKRLFIEAVMNVELTVHL